MKLATALIERADIQKRIKQLKVRLENNAKVQEGELPAEAPEDLLKELAANFEKLEELMCRINNTNNVTISEKSGLTLTALIAKRDCLSSKAAIMRDFLDAASSTVTRYSNTEIKVLSTVDVRKLQAEVDTISKNLRITDEEIQSLNWTTELI